MKLSFECYSCRKEVEFDAPDRSDYMEITDVCCHHCEMPYTVELYFSKGEFFGFKEFDYGWYAEHGDEDFTVNL